MHDMASHERAEYRRTGHLRSADGGSNVHDAEYADGADGERTEEGLQAEDSQRRVGG